VSPPSFPSMAWEGRYLEAARKANADCEDHVSAHIKVTCPANLALYLFIRWGTFWRQPATIRPVRLQLPPPYALGF
jgi:hypothetical protein